MTLCKERVERGQHEYDAHGRYWQTWTEDCCKPVHRHGRCQAHHRQHVSKLTASIQHYRERIAACERELAELQDAAVCAGNVP